MHASSNSTQVRGTVEALCEALTIPSESVQRAVHRCLGPLVATLKDDKDYVGQLLARMKLMVLTHEKYGHRRGGAFGLAAVVSGLGISSLKSHGIMEALCEAVEHKKDHRQREGALFAFSALCETMGR